MHPNLHQVAIGYLLDHQAQHLSHDRPYLLARCAEHLQQQHDTSLTTANVVAMQAFGELEARDNRANVVLSRSTSYAVFVADPDNRTSYAFTAADLVRIAREATGRAAAPVATH